jgi:flagellar biosynthesis regulator FlbT
MAIIDAFRAHFGRFSKIFQVPSIPSENHVMFVDTSSGKIRNLVFFVVVILVFPSDEQRMESSTLVADVVGEDVVMDVDPPAAVGESVALDSEVVTTTATTAPKLIRKRNLHQEEDSDDNGEDKQSEDEEQAQLKAAERQQREGLIDYLHRNNMDEKYAEDYNIVLRALKPKGKSKTPEKSQGPRFKVLFTAPNGFLLESKGDVLADIQERRSRKQQQQGNKLKASLHGAMSRDECINDARKKLEAFELPARIDSIKVFDFGRVDVRSGFHSCVQVYPVGYKCEQTVSGLTLSKGVFRQEVLCEIRELDGFPEFRVTSKSTGTTVLGSSEESVWKQVRTITTSFTTLKG